MRTMSMATRAELVGATRWRYLRKNKLANSVFATYEDIVEACCKAWSFFANNSAAVTSITARDWAHVSC